MTTTTSKFLSSLRDLLFRTAAKASVAFVVASVPAVVALVQQDFGRAAGEEVAALATALGVYKVSNK